MKKPFGGNPLDWQRVAKRSVETWFLSSKIVIVGKGGGGSGL